MQVMLPHPSIIAGNKGPVQLSFLLLRKTNTALFNDNPVTVYPNPAEESVNFRFENPLSEPALIVITDEAGRATHQFTMFESQEINWDTRALPAGDYYYSIFQNGRMIRGSKFIIYH